MREKQILYTLENVIFRHPTYIEFVDENHTYNQIPIKQPKMSTNFIESKTSDEMENQNKRAVNTQHEEEEDEEDQQPRKLNPTCHHLTHQPELQSHTH